MYQLLSIAITLVKAWYNTTNHTNSPKRPYTHNPDNPNSLSHAVPHTQNTNVKLEFVIHSSIHKKRQWFSLDTAELEIKLLAIAIIK